MKTTRHPVSPPPSSSGPTPPSFSLDFWLWPLAFTASGRKTGGTEGADALRVLIARGSFGSQPWPWVTCWLAALGCSLFATGGWFPRQQQLAGHARWQRVAGGPAALKERVCRGDVSVWGLSCQRPCVESVALVFNTRKALGCSLFLSDSLLSLCPAVTTKYSQCSRPPMPPPRPWGDSRWCGHRKGAARFQTSTPC